MEKNKQNTAKSSQEEEEELVAGAGSDQRNWRGILIALLVILIVTSFVVLAIILITPKNDDKKLGRPIHFDEFIEEKFKPKEFNGEWVTDSIYSYITKENEIMTFDCKNNKTTVVMDNATFHFLSVQRYSVSPDLNFILIASNVTKIFRHSSEAFYSIYDIEQKQKVKDFPGLSTNILKNKRLQLASWSSTGHSMIFIYNNNIYYQDKPISNYKQITTDGIANQIYNGICDWLYEEEILGQSTAYLFSPNNNLLLYIQFDDRLVELYQFNRFDTDEDFLNNVSYPKAGVVINDQNPQNPKVKLFVVNLVNDNTKKYQLEQPEKGDYYIWKFRWINDKKIIVVWLNRLQNLAIHTIYMVNKEGSIGKPIQIFHDKSTIGWVSPSNIFILGDGHSYATILAKKQGDGKLPKNLAVINTENLSDNFESIPKFITNEEWEKDEILGFDKELKFIYYMGNGGDSRQRHMFGMKLLDDNTVDGSPICFTCNRSDGCLFFKILLSETADYYIEYCLGPIVPKFTLKSLRSNYEVILEENAQLVKELETIAMPVKEYHEITLEKGHETYTILASLTLPPFLNKNHITKYPLLVYTYAGPGSHMVTEAFKMDWHTYLSSSENVIVLIIDGRGSGGRGQEYSHILYKKLGILEVEDQVEITKYFIKKYVFIDEKRVAIWGWSYGGFVAAHALGYEKTGAFKCAISVAPVTDWRFYDTAYTERYMGLYKDNENVYKRANVIDKVDNFKNKKFLLIHGTADDNVHFTHSANLMKALTKNEILYRVQIYPDENHLLSGHETNLHLYKTMSNFMKYDCFNGSIPKEFSPETNKKKNI